MSSAKRWLFGLELNVLQFVFFFSGEFGPLQANKVYEGLNGNVSIKDPRPDSVIHNGISCGRPPGHP